MNATYKTTSVLLVTALCLSLSAKANEDCTAADDQKKDTSALLHSYAGKGENDPETFSIAGIGNHVYFLDQNFDPIQPEEVAVAVKNTPGFDRIKRIVLGWSYSTWGDAPFAHALQNILNKPVVGFSGPTWWYPDGAAFASQAERATIQGPNSGNVAQCITSDGKYHERSECLDFLKTHDPKSAVFGNSTFFFNCADIHRLELLSESGDPDASMRLYFLNYFVNIDGKKAVTYLSRAAAANVPLANYLVARSFMSQSPPEMTMYRQFLSRAASGGDKKAQSELDKLGDK